MRWFCTFSLLALATSPAAMLADVVSYGQPGIVALSTALTATSTGVITGYFYNSAAGGTDYVRLVDVTSGSASLFLLDNHTSTPGAPVSFGAVTAGDQLVFELVNSDVETTDGYTDFTALGPIDPNARTNQYLLSSDPAYSVDGINHAYVTAFAGDALLGIPEGVYVGMEDLPLGKSDLDYNDTEFAFTNVSSAAVTPEPASWLLLGTGILGFISYLRRQQSC